VENVLGGFASWPTSIIRLLLVEEPTIANVRRVAAFFYGNGLPVHVAARFYNLYNGKHPFFHLANAELYTLYEYKL
jgi:hypothetical protein